MVLFQLISSLDFSCGIASLTKKSFFEEGYGGYVFIGYEHRHFNETDMNRLKILTGFK